MIKNLILVCLMGLFAVGLAQTALGQVCKNSDCSGSGTLTIYSNTAHTTLYGTAIGNSALSALTFTSYSVGYYIEICKNTNFGTPCKIFRTPFIVDLANVPGWNNAAKSIRAYAVSSFQQGIAVYSDYSLGGNYEYFEYDQGDLSTTIGWNTISSAQVFPYTCAVLFQDLNYVNAVWSQSTTLYIAGLDVSPNDLSKSLTVDVCNLPTPPPPAGSGGPGPTTLQAAFAGSMKRSDSDRRKEEGGNGVIPPA